MNWSALRDQLSKAFSAGRLGPGVSVIGVVVGLRLLGLLQFLELLSLDGFQYISKAEETDLNLVLVGIDSQYLEGKENASPDYEDLASIIETILDRQPAVVGVDVTEDTLSGEDKSSLISLFKNNPNLITVDKIRPPAIAPIEGLPNTVIESQIGFNDFSFDIDEDTRRMFLGWSLGEPAEVTFRESFATILAKRYLLDIHNIELENGRRDEGAMRFGEAEIPRLRPSSGAYYREQSIYGIQTLINFRGGSFLADDYTKSFNLITATQIANGNIRDSSFKEKIVIIGFIDPINSVEFDSVLPLQQTNRENSSIENLSNFNNGTNVKGNRITGLELQAHAVSQITSAALYGRPLITPISVPYEYIIIIACGFLGIGVKYSSKSSIVGLLYLLSIGFALFLASYWGLVLLGMWLPFAPAMLVFTVNSVVYIAVGQSERKWQKLVQERDSALLDLKLERQRTISHIFDTIHNGPLQTLAHLFRLIQDGRIANSDIAQELKKLNIEIREIGESLKQDAMSDEDKFIKVGKSRLDLNTPLHELFYEIYRETLERSFPGFQTLKIKARSLEPVEPEQLPVEYKRKLCRFFEELLCNVGKHATGATKLTVTGKTIDDFYILRVVDNGIGTDNINDIKKGRGTKISKELETSLKGKFIRRSNYPKGIFCEFKWQLIRA